MMPFTKVHTKTFKKSGGPAPSFNWDTPIQYLKGVGPFLAKVFGRRNIHTLQDIICWYPRAYRDQRIVHDFSRLPAGTYVTVCGEVAGKKSASLSRPPSQNRRMYVMNIQTKTGMISCKYFRLPFRGYFDSLEIGDQVRASGRLTYYKDQPELHHPDLHPFNEGEEHTDHIIPLYTELERVSQHKIRKIIKTALTLIKEKHILIEDPLPSWLCREHHLIDRFSALEQMHQPEPGRIDEYLQYRSPAQKRLIFEEFFYLQLYMSLKKRGLESDKAYAMTSSSLKDQLTAQLPFKLTPAQCRVLDEIAQDLQKTSPMHRLLQGDVGCGKTVVALLACSQAIDNRFQCVIMAPTEILATQHYKNACQMLEPLGVRVSLLTGKLKAREKRNITEKLATGYTSLCIGTHALIQEVVGFHRLGLVIIDEQHRFGVHQRNKLKQKGISPHFLVMTATPIPRSLAMTLYGDLDVSVIDEMPVGRGQVVTRRTHYSDRSKVWGFVESQIREGRQAYVVYPLVEESEHLDLKNAIQEYEILKKRFARYRLGLLHGRMNAAGKQEVMSQFVEGGLDILVSTTVIEVGVDVRNATVMVVEHADRFGLSQLHQLRGRAWGGGLIKVIVYWCHPKAWPVRLYRASRSLSKHRMDLSWPSMIWRQGGLASF